MDNVPIGVFDSGIGGLTVLKALREELPHESFIYLGDTARVPYGSHTPQTISQFAHELLRFILKQKVKLIVVACNTIAATCIEELKKESPVPLISVVEPTIEEAFNISKTKRIGVIGTRATIESNIYKKNIELLDPTIQVFQQPCPLFVPIVEEGLNDHIAAKEFAENYLALLKKEQIDTLILGCTHYPLLKSLIQEVIGRDVLLIDSAYPTAQFVKQTLQENNLFTNNNEGKVTLQFTEISKTTKMLVEKFLEGNIADNFDLVDLTLHS